MVGEFLGSRQPAVPQTFHMGSLLEELQATQQPPLQTQRHPVLEQEGRGAPGSGWSFGWGLRAVFSSVVPCRREDEGVGGGVCLDTPASPDHSR